MEATLTLIADARVHDLGDGFMVRRMLPDLQARHVGPFVFFDHIGPTPSLPAMAWSCARIRTSAWPR